MSVLSHAASRSCGSNSFLLLSSTRVYARAGTTHEDAMLPTVPADPSDLYNLTKLAGEALCLAHPCAATRVVRLSNVYGIDMSADTFLGQVLREGGATGGVEFRQGPASAKDYVNVAAVVRLLPAIATRGRQRIYNVAAGSEHQPLRHRVLPVRHRRLAHRLRAQCADGTAAADRHRAARRRVRPNRQQSRRRPARPAGRCPGIPMLTIDEAHGRVTVHHADGTAEEHALDTPEAFEAVSAAWLRCGWDVKYVYGFTWMGRPVIQLPEDMIRIQEVIWRVRPDVIVETGVAHGGSLVFYASLFEAMGHGRVIGIDIEIRRHNRTAIEAHPLASRITLIQGSSAAPGTLAAVRHRIAPGESVLVVLDSNHSRAHVEAELDLYAPLVTPGSLHRGLRRHHGAARRRAAHRARLDLEQPGRGGRCVPGAQSRLRTGRARLPLQRGRGSQPGHLLAKEFSQAALIEAK